MQNEQFVKNTYDVIGVYNGCNKNLERKSVILNHMLLIFDSGIFTPSYRIAGFDHVLNVCFDLNSRLELKS